MLGQSGPFGLPWHVWSVVFRATSCGRSEFGRICFGVLGIRNGGGRASLTQMRPISTYKGLQAGTRVICRL